MNDTKEIVFSFGAFKSPKDYRDVPLAALMPTAGAFPDSYFVDVKSLPIWNQKQNGSCTGHAGAKYKQKLDQIETSAVIPLSARFVYALAKCFDGIAEQGTYPRMIMKMGQKYGFATEGTVVNNSDLDHETYVFNRNAANIPQAAFTEAANFAISGYAFPDTSANGLKQAIISSNGAMLLLEVGSEWWTSRDGSYTTWAESEILPLRVPKTTLAGHEVYLYGYDTVNGRDRFWIMNSWSDLWAHGGTGYFFYDEYAPYIVEAVTAVDLPTVWKDQLKNMPPAQDFRYAFTVDIIYGERNDRVKNLQTALKIDGCFPKTITETGYYGEITASAVKQFQYKYKVAPTAEIESLAGRRVGPKTRAALNALFNK